MARFCARPALCALGLFTGVSSYVSAQTVDEFYCGPSEAPMKMWIANGRLHAYNNKTLDYGPVEVTDTSYRSRLAQPLMTDGSGHAELTWSIDRQTGRFEFEMNAVRPGKKPFHSLLEGICSGVDAASLPSSAQKPSLPAADQQRKEPHASPEVVSEQNVPKESELKATSTENARLNPTDQAHQGQADKQQKHLEQERKNEEARKAREKAQAEQKRKEEDARIAREKAERDAKEKADQQRRNNETGLRSSFRGQATTCAGGGKDVLYLQTSCPSVTGCNVRFEARCPGTPAVVAFGQKNYVGGSCMGIGDAIKIGVLPCPAPQVQISMTSAQCFR